MVGPLRARLHRRWRGAVSSLLFSSDSRARSASLVLTCALRRAARARATPPRRPCPAGTPSSSRCERIDADRVRLMREVEIEGEPGSRNAGQKFFADDLRDEHQDRRADRRAATSCSRRRPRASPPTAWCSTPRRRLGTFNNASGIAQLGERGAAQSQHVRRARAGRVLLRRARSRRSASTSTASRRAASPPACSRRRDGKSSAAARR